MLYFGSLFLMLAMIVMVSVVGRRICDVASFRLGPVYRFYFSPLFGLAFFIVLFTIHGWLAPFRAGSSIAIVAILVLAGLYFERNRRRLLQYLSAIALFSLLASSPVFFPLLQFDSYNPFNDTFTYLVHGQWLQDHAFTDPALATGHHPALTQVKLYQAAGHRMGASFFLGWAQSVFGLQWSYYVYPAAVSVPLIAGALAVGGAVKLIVRRQRLVSILAAAAMATMFNGFAYGAMSGFFPQTFGLAFAVGSTTLLGALLVEGLRQRDVRAIALSATPVALSFAALIITYNDMLSFVAAGAAVSILLLLRSSDQYKRMLTILVVLIAEIALLVNFELVRVIRNFVGVLLNVGGGSYVIGWPVLWSPAEFLAHAFGFKASLEGLWIFGSKGMTLPIVIVLVLATLYFVATSAFRRKRQSIYVELHLSVLLIMVAGFVYFRYFGRGPAPEEAGIGYTFLQFKLAKWASPFCLVLMGATFAHFQNEIKGHYAKAMPALLAVIICLGTVGNYRFAGAETGNFLDETGYRRSGFSSLLHLRELANRLGPDAVIYLNVGPEHEKLRQMVAYVLYDKKLAADWSGDNYIGGHLAPDQRNMPYQAAGWVIEFADAVAARSMSAPIAGHLLLKKMPEYFANLTSVKGGYPRETDGVNSWNWTARSLSYTYRIMGKAARLKFTYMPISAGREVKVIIQGKDTSEMTLKMKEGWNEFVSPPIELCGRTDLSIRFESDSNPVRISVGDSRLASFAIRNLELVRHDEGSVSK